MEYMKTDIQGSSYRRAFQIIIYNELNKVPVAEMRRQDIINLGDRVIDVVAPTLPIPYDPTKQIALINPETGEPLGATSSMQELFVILFSLFVQESATFDAK